MTKDEIFKYCLLEKENLRTQKILESKSKVNFLYRNEEILQKVNLLGKLKIDKVKLELKNKDASEIEKEINKIKYSLAVILKQYGIKIKDLNAKFECEKCQDKGIIQNENGDEILCECLKQDYFNSLLNFSETNFNDIPLLKDIVTNEYSKKEEIDTLIKILESLIKNQKYNTILFSGETGTGKTYISKSFLKTYILSNKLGLFLPAFNLNNELVKYHFDWNANKNLERYLEPDLLVIEDLGTEIKNNNYNIFNEYLLHILNDRQEANKLTLFTTNLTLNDIKDRYNERFLSRLVDKKLSLKYNFKGKDIRLIQ